MKKKTGLCLLFVCLLIVFLPQREVKAANITSLSDQGRRFIQSCEGLSLEAYQDQAGVWTIGWGHTGGVYSGMKITEAQAQEYFRQDIATWENEVVKYASKMNVSFSQQQFDALVSFTYNVGSDPFASDTRLSIAIARYGANIPTDKVWECFATWHHVSKKDNKGLFYRRMNEARIYALGDYTRSLNWKIPSWLRPGQQGGEVPDGWVPEEYGGFVIPDTDPTVDFRVPLIAYTDTEGNVTTYVSSSGNTVSGYIEGKTDQCVIRKVFENGRVEVEYPTPNGNKTANAYLSDFINTSYAVSHYTYSVSGNTPVYRRRDLSESMGTAFSSDSIIVVGEAGGCLQIIYPVSGGYKLGWISGTTGGSGSGSSSTGIDSQYPTPLKAYTNASGNVTTYSAVNGSSTGAIFTSDLCVIQEVYTNGWCKVTYPTSSGDKTAYTQFSNFLDTGCQVTPSAYQPGQTVSVYRRRNLAESFGSVWTSDNCIIVARSGDLCQLIYPLDAGGYKMGWANLSVSPDPNVSWPTPFRCYINSATDRASVYQGIDSNPGYGQIFVDDECTVNAVYSNGWANVTYPISGGTKTGYVPLSVFVPNGINPYTDTASKRITSYQKSNMANSYGYADQGDGLVIVGKMDGKVQMIYPVPGGYKLAWAYESDFSKTLSSVSITAKPQKLTYVEGQNIDYSGLQVTASYSDHTTAVVSNYTKSGYDSTPGEKTITISYSENGVTKTAAFSVTVLAKKPSSLRLTKTPSRTVYIEGQTDFDFSDLTAVVTYDNGTTAQVDNYELFGFSEEVGTHIVTVKYTENGSTVSASFSMTVQAKSLEVIYASALNDQDLYVVRGGTLDQSRIQVVAAYDNGDLQVVTDYSISGLDSSMPGNQILTISYGGKQTNLSVTVLESETMENVMTNPDMWLPLSLTKIEAGAFRGCAAKWVRMGERVTYIDDYAFADCPYLTQIYIPSETSFISETAFIGLSKRLTIYGWDGSYAEYYAVKNGYGFVAVDK